MRRALCVLLATAACTAQPAAVPTPTPTPTPVPTATPAPVTPRPGATAFSAARAEDWIERITALGPREATSDGYRRAAGLVARGFRAQGLTVERDRFGVPGGAVYGRRVEGGTTENVIGMPPGFDASKPHLVVGGHLDTVLDTVGANDNASGIAVILELARVSRIAPPPLPVVFVAFGAEERREGSGGEQNEQYTFGARRYAGAMSATEREAVAGMLNLDMVGNGDRVIVIGSGALYRHTLRRARAIDVPAGPGSAPGLFSDHTAFAERGIEVAWLWAGEHPSLHTPEDTPGVIQRAELSRVGRLAWDALRTFGA